MPVLLLIPAGLFIGEYIYLNASGPLLLLVPIELPLFLGLIERYNNRLFSISSWGRYVRIGIYLLLLSSFLTFILLIPDSLYNAWLILLMAGKQGGVISFAFVYAMGIVSSLGCTALVTGKSPGHALVEMLLMVNMVLVILYPRWVVFTPFLLLSGFRVFILQAEPGKSWISFISPFLLIVPSLAFAFGIPQLRESPAGNPVIDRISGSLQKSMAVMFPDLPVILNVPGYGTSFGSSRKTGEKPLLSPRVVFTVEGSPGSVLYLKTDIFHTMSGQWWMQENTEEPVRVNEIPETGVFEKYKLTFMTDLYTRVPVSGKTDLFEYNSGFYSIQGGAAFSPPERLPIVKGDIITLYNGPGVPVSKEQLEFEAVKSLNVPEPIEEKLYPLATGLRGATDEDSLRNIRNYLREHYRYSLETKSSENMTENFLFESYTGYCVHFSTAAALLARTLDIPVRIAEGFILQIPETEDDYGIPSSYGRSTAYVTGFSAHQWPEVLSGGSWVPWEVTPPYMELSEKTRDRTPSYDRYTQKQLESLGLEEISPVEKDTQRMNIPFMTRMFLAFLIPFALALSVVLLISYRNRYSETTVRRKLKRLVKKGNRRLGLPSPEETGWVAWFGFCTLKTRCQNSPEQEFQNLILKFQYGNDPLNPDEKKKLIMYIKNLMKLRNQKSIVV